MSEIQQQLWNDEQRRLLFERQRDLHATLKKLDEITAILCRTEDMVNRLWREHIQEITVNNAKMENAKP